jgi:hypothetical protein
MTGWFQRLCFLWEEEATPAEEVPRGGREEPAGVPRPLRIATRWALIAVAATTLMGQIIGTRLVATVDAAQSYNGSCNSSCDGSNCIQNCATAPDPKLCKQCCQNNHTACHNFCSTSSCMLTPCTPPPGQDCQSM